jgi:alcohol dehydrogenase (cytochrome c)
MRNRAQYAFGTCGNAVRSCTAVLVVRYGAFLIDPVSSAGYSPLGSSPGTRGDDRQEKWELKLNSPATAGILSTAGGLVFSAADEGNSFALDARTGRTLWEFQTGSSVHANPISFLVGGHQCIAIAADRVLYVFSL